MADDPLTDELEAGARRALAEVVGVLDAVRGRVAACAHAFAAACDAAVAAGRAPRRADLDALVPLLRRTAAGLPVGGDGAGVVTAPGLLADEPLWIEWWRRAGAGGTERLEVTFDADDPACFDYPEAEWFAVPRDRGCAWVAGPFVDQGGTNRHLCTYSVPVLADGGAFAGIAGADLRVGEVEALGRRALRAIGGAGLVVTRDGRVLASLDPAQPAGTLVPPVAADAMAHARPGTAVAWDRDLPWGVVALSAAPSRRPPSARARR